MNSATETTTEPKAEVRTRDLVARMLQVDLSLPLQHKLSPLEKGDHLVGVMSQNLQRLYTVRMEMHADAKKGAEKVEDSFREHMMRHLEKDQTVPHDCAAFYRKHDALETEALPAVSDFKLVDEIFWKMVRLEFPEISDKGVVGVREDYQVVWSDDDVDTVFELLKEVASVLGRPR